MEACGRYNGLQKAVVVTDMAGMPGIWWGQADTTANSFLQSAWKDPQYEQGWEDSAAERS